MPSLVLPAPGIPETPPPPYSGVIAEAASPPTVEVYGLPLPDSNDNADGEMSDDSRDEDDEMDGPER